MDRRRAPPCTARGSIPPGSRPGLRDRRDEGTSATRVASPRIVFNGRLAAGKGPDVLVEALARLARVPAFLVGDGPLRDGLQARARALGLRRRVTFTGWQREPAGWVAGAGVVAAPPREDAWSQSVVPAMALGTPVVAAAVDGLPDLLADRRGILVAPEDPDALAAALADVLAGRRRPDAGAARAYASAFTFELVAARYAATYQRLLASTRDRAWDRHPRATASSVHLRRPAGSVLARRRRRRPGGWWRRRGRRAARRSCG
jgi:glycosyltransferase involved in cell wall biosynthesis